jgi:ribonuclease HI
MKTSYAARLEFQCTNNIAEYKAILSWRKLKAMVVKMEVLEVDSQVITCHVDKSSNARNLTLEKYLDIV